MRLRVSSPRRTVMTFSSAPQEMYRWVNQWNHRARFGIGLWGTSSTAKLGQIASRTRSRSLPVPTGSRSDSVFPSLPSTVTWTLWYPQMRHNNDWVISTPWMRWTGMVLVSRLVNPCTDFNPSPERYKVSPQLFESLVHRNPTILRTYAKHTPKTDPPPAAVRTVLMMNTSTSMRKAELVTWERTKRPFGTVRMTSSSRRRSSH